MICLILNLTLPNKLDELFQDVSNDSNIFIKCLKLKCMSCHEMSLDKCNIKYYAGQLYSHGNKPQKCFIVGKECIKCRTLHLPSYFVSKGNRTFYDDTLLNRYFAITQETVYEILLLRSLPKDILFKHNSFTAFTNSYNSLFDNTKQNKEDRTELVDKRTWFYYHLLKCRKKDMVSY